MNMNIRVKYFYRDAGNYKRFNDVVFSNPELLRLEILNLHLHDSLIDRMYFIAQDTRLPECFLDELNDDDHDWHEFESLEETNDEPTDEYGRSIKEFVVELKMSCRDYNRL